MLRRIVLNRFKAFVARDHELVLYHVLRENGVLELSFVFYENMGEGRMRRDFFFPLFHQ